MLNQPPMFRMPPYLRTLLIVVGVVAVTLLAYQRAGSLGFVNYDDPWYATDNPMVQGGMSHESLSWAFTTFTAANWHPVTWLSHMADVELFGAGVATGPHWVNVGIHACNAILLWLLLQGLTHQPWPSALVSALFALHPLHVESVAWIAERKDLLSTLFGLLALHCYRGWADRSATPMRAILAGLGGVLCFALSLMSKPMLVTLPCVMLLLDIWPMRRIDVRSPDLRRAAWLLLEKAPLLAMSAASSLITLIAQSRGGAMTSLEHLSAPIRITNAVMAYVIYLGQTFWPVNLSVSYPYPEHVPAVKWSIAAIVLIGITILCVMQIRRRPFLLVGWLWFLGTLVPVIGLVQVGRQPHADRYTYVPLIGIFVMFAWLAGEVWSRQHRAVSRWVLLGVLAGSLLALALRTHDQVRHWRDSITLFTHAIQAAGPTAVASNNLGGALIDAGRITEAIGHLRSAIELFPSHAPAYSNLGVAYIHAGAIDDAERQFLAAQALNPSDVRSAYNLGVLHLQAGRHAQAERLFRHTLEIDPNHHDAMMNLGSTLMRQARPDEAIPWYQRALRAQPTNATNAANLGQAFVQVGQIDRGTALLRQAVEAEPGAVQARLNLGQALLDAQQPELAASEFREALAIDAESAHGHRGLGIAMRRIGDAVTAIKHLQRSVEIEPEHAIAHLNLGLAKAQLGDFAAAEQSFRAAARQSPFPEALDNLGNALSAQGRHAEALEAYRSAIAQRPEFASAHYNSGTALLALNRPREAAASLRRALELRPDDRQAGHNLGLALLAVHDWLGAQAAFESILAADPRHLAAMRGWIESVVSRDDASDTALTEALARARLLVEQTAQRDPAALIMLAAAQSRHAQFEAAHQTAREAESLANSLGQSAMAREAARGAALYASGRLYEPKPAR